MVNQFETPACSMLSRAENQLLSPPLFKRKRSEASYSDYFLPSSKALPSPLLLPALGDDLDNTPPRRQEDDDLPPRFSLQPRPCLRKDLHKRKTFSPISILYLGLTFDDAINTQAVLKRRRTSLSMVTAPALEETFSRRSSLASCA
jgi:hypothetical protein